MKTYSVMACLAAVASAFPQGPRLNDRAVKMWETTRRQANPESAAGLTDLDILNL